MGYQGLTAAPNNQKRRQNWVKPRPSILVCYSARAKRLPDRVVRKVTLVI